MSDGEFAIWPDGAPGALGTGAGDVPTLTPFLPAAGKATGAGLIICPGGGYMGLAPHEGQGYAEYFAGYGLTCFVLKYRLGSAGYHHPAMLQDAQRAIRLVRADAAKWGIDPKKIGIMGSSAGGHLTSMAVTHFDAGDAAAADAVERVSSRPDLGILCYPVISMGPSYAHQGSREALLGPFPAPGLADQLSSEKQVTAETPPCFIWHTWEDGAVKVENSLMFAAALRAKGVPFDLHIYDKGSHGLGLGKSTLDPKQYLPWAYNCVHWLHVQGFIP